MMRFALIYLNDLRPMDLPLTSPPRLLPSTAAELLAQAPIGLLQIDAAGNCVYVNRRYEAITGQAHHEALGDGWLQRVHADDAVGLAANWRAAIAQRKAFDATYRLVRPDCCTIHVRLRTSPITIDGRLDGEVTAFAGVLEDMTVYQDAQELLVSTTRRVRLITDTVPALIGYIDAEERLRFCNINYQTQFGLREDQLIGSRLIDVFGAAVYATIASHVSAALSGQRISYDRVFNIAGIDRSQQCEYVPDTDADGTVHGFYALVTDVTERHLAEKNLAMSERRLRMISDNLPVSIAYLDAERRVRFANHTFLTWTGTTPEKTIGSSFAEIVGATPYAQRREFVLRAAGGETVEFVLDTVLSGALRTLHSVYVPDIGAAGQVNGIYMLSSDISELKKTENELRRLARFDSLTGLPNRAQLYDQLHAALARCRRSRSGIAVLFLDIDHFKAINDSLGHACGDQVLQEFARRLCATVRVTDTVARLAGDEFVIVLEGVNLLEEAGRVAEKILAQVAQAWVLAERELRLTTSIGIAFDPSSKQDGKSLIAYADESLYQAKAAGRNTHRGKIL